MYSLNNTFSKKIAVMAGIAIMAAIIIFTYSGFGSHKAQASSLIYDAHGYAWSSTIGWVSLNCEEGSSTGGTVCSRSNYKVTADMGTGGVMSGYAWSSNVGWISFNSGDVSSCGTGPAVSGGNIEGWARVVSGTTTSGADGCIKLNHLGVGPGPYDGVTYNDTSGALGGFAWGSTNVGWLNFDGATLVSSTATVSGVDLKIRDGGTGILVDGPLSFPTLDPSMGLTYSSELDWTSDYVSSCRASASFTSTDWNSTTVVPIMGGQSVSYPANRPGTFTWTIICHSVDTTLPDVTDSVTINLTGTDYSTGAWVDMKVNGISGPTDGPITMPTSAGGIKHLTWTSSAVDTPCASSTSPAVIDWGTAETSVPSDSTTWGGYDIGVPANTTTSPITYTYKISCTPSLGGAPAIDVVNITVPAPTVPWCEVSPVATSSTVAVGPFDITSPFGVFGVIWHGAPFSPADVTIDGSSTPFTATISPGTGTTSTLSTPTSTLTIHVTGTMTSTMLPQVIRVTAVSAGTTCTPGTYTVAPPGTTRLPGHHRPPWIEF